MTLSNATKRKLEALLGMGSGYVLDFTNATFQDFVLTAIGVDPTMRYLRLVGGFVRLSAVCKQHHRSVRMSSSRMSALGARDR